MRSEEVSRIVVGIVLVVVAVAVFVIKSVHGNGVVAVVSADPLLPVGCLAIALLGVLVSASAFRRLARIRLMTSLIRRAVNEENRVVTRDVAGAARLHEVEVRERIDEMIKKREIPTGTRITYIGGEKVVGQPKR